MYLPEHRADVIHGLLLDPAGVVGAGLLELEDQALGRGDEPGDPRETQEPDGDGGRVSEERAVWVEGSGVDHVVGDHRDEIEGELGSIRGRG